MSKPTEHKTVQVRILQYAQQIGWTLVSREEAEGRRGFDRSEHKDRKENATKDVAISLGWIRFGVSTGRRWSFL